MIPTRSDLEQARDALRAATPEHVEEAMKRAADLFDALLAQEPVAWRVDGNGFTQAHYMVDAASKRGSQVTPLYAMPAAGEGKQ